MRPGPFSWLTSAGGRPAWLWPAFLFSALYAFFFRDLLSMCGGFVFGDYALQFYPWSFVYWQGLRESTLPLWTPLMQSGFPLFAEGQTGMLYAINFLLFKSLPFHAAYNGVFLLHFLMGGLFMYAFSRARGLSEAASGMAAICFAFGSVYAGSFYNLVSMRSLVWFPLALYFAERMVTARPAPAAFALALVLGQSWLGGFPQTSVYAAGFTAFYFVWRALEARAAGRAGWFAAALLLSLAIGAPQLWATQQLALSSTRSRMDASFVFWGSAPPWNLATLFYYGAGTLMPARIYLGVAPFFLSWLCIRERAQRVWWAMAGLALFFALGIYNPLVWPLAKAPGFAMLRNPSKLLFFLVFALILLGARGLDRWRENAAQGGDLARRLSDRIVAFSSLAAALLGGCMLLVHRGGEWLLAFGDWYTRHFVVGKSHHRWSPEHYAQKVRSILGSAQAELSLDKPAVWIPFILAALVVLLLRSRWRRAPALCLALLSADLFLYGYLNYGSSFVGNVRPWPELSVQRALPADGVWLDLMPQGRQVMPANRNLLTGHASAGAYSPLLDAAYFERLGALNVLDDAFGGQDPEPSRVAEHKEFLDRLGVRYLVVPDGVSIPGLDARSRIVPGASLLVNPAARTDLELTSGTVMPMAREWSALSLRTEAREAGTLTWVQTYDQGWKAWVDERPAPVSRAEGVFMSVEVPSGEHQVRFEFRPDYIEIGGWCFAAGWTAALSGLLITTASRRRTG